jgi:LDH2 family malate/lactate/ureidoglycolate dehydrogenase
MAENVVYLPVATVRSFMVDVLLSSGVPKADAETCADVYIAADLRGIESHGIGRLRYYWDRLKSGQHQPVTNFEVVREAPATATVDAHHGMGPVVGVRAMQMAIDKARVYGLGAVAVRNSTHFGIAGYYPLMAIKAGMAGLTFTNARPAISPTFGVKPMLGTNPIAFGAPSEDPEVPFLFDGATSTIQRGKVEVMERKEKPLLEGWVIDQNEQPATDPAKVLEGLTRGTHALLPLGGAGDALGGHKGYGLATMVELFSAAFASGAFLYGLTGIGPQGQKQPFRVGHFFMAMSIEHFTPLDEFKATTSGILRDLRQSTKAPGGDRIYAAGEKEAESAKRVQAEGIPIVPNLQKDLKFLQQELKITGYKFPF